MIFKPLRPKWWNGWIGRKANTHPKRAEVSARKSAHAIVRPCSETKQGRQQEAQLRDGSGTELRQIRNAPDHEAVPLVLVNAEILRIGLRIALDFFFRRTIRLAGSLRRRAQRDDTDQTDHCKDSNRFHGSKSHSFRSRPSV